MLRAIEKPVKVGRIQRFFNRLAYQLGGTARDLLLVRLDYLGVVRQFDPEFPVPVRQIDTHNPSQ